MEELIKRNQQRAEVKRLADQKQRAEESMARFDRMSVEQRHEAWEMMV